ncbi:MAG: DUF3368 domain-containing protein, partial [Candidatus Wallbacteria bacterium]|nr:DUF3368 domain-containing protein [Candidatus Wallbacteria bacterium]
RSSRAKPSIGVFDSWALGLVLLAKQRGTIPSARSVLERLRQAGMFLADTLMNRALTRVDE